MNSLLLWLKNGIAPWRCPVCFGWSDDYYMEFEIHNSLCPGGCDGTGIRWAWLRYLGRLRATLPMKFKWWWLDHRPWHVCIDCGRLDYVLGREMGDHNLCMPF